MRFVCEQCQTRYVVADDRIQGRTFKVRCKKCGNLILVKARAQTAGLEPEAGPPPASPPRRAALASAAPDQATQLFDDPGARGSAATPALRFGDTTAGEREVGNDEPPEWHVILPQGQIGPLPLSALIQKMVGGEMPPRSFVWRDGMEDWKRAADVPEVARWLPSSRPSTPPAPAPAPSGRSRSGVIEAAAQEFFEADPHAETPHTPSALQPLAHVDTAPELTSSRAGELTRFFITQAHVAQGRSWWRVLAFGLGAAVLLVGGIIGLAELGVPVPLVAQAPSTQPKVFTGAEGDSRVRDLLYGRPKAKSSAAAGASGHRGSPSDPGAGANQGPLATRAEQHVDQLGKSDKDQLSRLYASQDLSDLKLKQSATALPVLDRPDAPLTAEQVSRTVAKFQTGYTRCIDGELKRNPSFPGGKIRIVTTIMSSGLVRQAQIVSDDQRLQRSVAGGPLGTCLSEQTRRMVFPSFQGEAFDAEIPLVLSSAL